MQTGASCLHKRKQILCGNVEGYILHLSRMNTVKIVVLSITSIARQETGQTLSLSVALEATFHFRRWKAYNNGHNVTQVVIVNAERTVVNFPYTTVSLKRGLMEIPLVLKIRPKSSILFSFKLTYFVANKWKCPQLMGSDEINSAEKRICSFVIYST